MNILGIISKVTGGSKIAENVTGLFVGENSKKRNIGFAGFAVSVILFQMDYIDVEFEHRIVITEDEIYGCKLRQFKEWDSPTNFPHNIDYLQTEWYKRPQPNMIGLEEKDFDKGLLREIIRIKKELNTPNLKFDILDNKILEFSYVYGELFPMKSYYISYDYYNDIFNKKKTTISEFSNKQQKSILKYFKLI